MSPATKTAAPFALPRSLCWPPRAKARRKCHKILGWKHTLLSVCGRYSILWFPAGSGRFAAYYNDPTGRLVRVCDVFRGCVRWDFPDLPSAKRACEGHLRRQESRKGENAKLTTAH